MAAGGRGCWLQGMPIWDAGDISKGSGATCVWSLVAGKRRCQITLCGMQDRHGHLGGLLFLVSYHSRCRLQKSFFFRAHEWGGWLESGLGMVGATHAGFRDGGKEGSGKPLESR